MFATAPATDRPARSSRGREMMRTTRPPVVDGLSLALQAASSDTSTSTTARIQASYAIVTDFFNGLLVVNKWQSLLRRRRRIIDDRDVDVLATVQVVLRAFSES